MACGSYSLVQLRFNGNWSLRVRYLQSSPHLVNPPPSAKAIPYLCLCKPYHLLSVYDTCIVAYGSLSTLHNSRARE